jgi:hypothetical protein
MIKFILLLSLLFFTACVNKHGISAKYYSDCDEYYDLQGYYHKDCGEDDIVTYKQVEEKIDEGVEYLQTMGKEPKPKPNVW